MDIITSIKRTLLVGIISLIVVTPIINRNSINLAPSTQWTFGGRVYEGNIGDEIRPITGVLVSVYGANNTYPDTGTLIRSTSTDSSGWYGLSVYDTDGLFNYYSIRVSDITDYVSVGATTVDGNIKTLNWIEYEVPLTGQILTGNKFWDRAPVLSGWVFAGSVGNESRPLAGVTVTLYCANNYFNLGNALTSTTTDAIGWYGLSTFTGGSLCDFYNIVESDPVRSFSVGAVTVGGSIINVNWIQYEAPYSTKTLTDNKFWDEITFMFYLPLLLKNH
jgi:hypothetical protein